MAVLTVSAPPVGDNPLRLLASSVAATLCVMSIGCSSVTGAQQLGSTASFPADGATPGFHVRLISAEFADQCPNRVVPGSVNTGEFLFLTVEVKVDDAQGVSVVSTSPERFRALDGSGEYVGGFNEETGWECFSDPELLPMLFTPGMTGTGLVVIESSPQARFVEFLYSDSESAYWEMGDTPDS